MTSLPGPFGFEPDTCQSGTVDWSPIASASAMSAFCGIFAGFVFAGIVVVIGEKNAPGRDGQAARGLKLLLACFFGFATAAYMYSIVTGELVCLRAETEALFAGAILAADVVVVIVGLAWLLLTYERNKHEELLFFRRLIQFAAHFSVLMLVVSSISFDNSMLRGRASIWSDVAVWVCGVSLMLAFYYFWRKPLPPTPPPMAPDHWRDEVLLNRRVTLCARTTLASGGILAVISGLSAVVPHDTWDDISPWKVYVLGQAALLIPGVVLVTAVRAIPRT